MEVILETNKYQTPVTKELLESLPSEVAEQLMECLTTIPFIKNLIAPDRPYYKDLPKDENGRAIVDLTNPPIMTDADYFRQPALHFLKHKCYTFLRPNSNPNSEYARYWAEETRRCWEGLTRPDGAWISGFNYWFLNYQPMMVNKRVGNSNKAIRVEEFPFFNEGNVWRYYYLDAAREQGHHAIELAKRGAHPYFQKVFTPKGWRNWGDIKVGDKLYGTDNTVCTVIDIPYDKESPYYKITLRDGRVIYATDDHLWSIWKKGKKLIVTTTWLLAKYKTTRTPSDRVPSGIEYNCFIPKNEGVEMEERSTLVDPYTFGLNCTKSEAKFIPDEFKYNSKNVRLQVLVGLLDTDGTVHGGVPTLNSSSKRLIKDAQFIARSLGYNTKITKISTGYKVESNEYKQCLDGYILSIYGGEELFRLPRKKVRVHYNSNNALSRKDRTCITNIEYVGTAPCKCVTVDSKDSCYLIGDFVTTHNCSKSYSLSAIMGRNLVLGESEAAHERLITILTAYQKEYLSDSKDGTLSKFKPAINFVFSHTPWPHLMLKNSPNEMTWQMGYKDSYGIESGSLNQVMAVSAKDDSSKLRGKRGTILYEEMGSFKNLLTLYDTTRKSVEDGDLVFAFMYLVGTSSEEESDFASAKTLLYNPEAYNIMSIPNVFDKPKQGKPTFGFFFPSYVNRAGCYNKDGVSDVVKSVIQVLLARYKAKHGANPQSVLRVIAEDPVTPAEAIIKVKAAYFPVNALSERLQQLDTDPHAFDDVFTGKLVLNSKGEAEFMHTEEEPIRKYGVENDTPGTIEIFEMPEKDRNGSIPSGRYIVGLDPVDNDQAESTSLSSTIVFDLFTDRIVAEYTGRQSFAEDNFEITRLLCMYYNAQVMAESNKKGWYAYFSKMNCTNYLALTPEYLREKQLIKYSSFGSNRFGINISAPIRDYANSMIRDWLLKPVTIIVQEDGKPVEINTQNLYLIRNRALIEELIAYNPEINTDRISALAQVMLYREEKLVKFGGKIEAEKDDKSSLKHDDFFSKNYDNKVKGSKFSNMVANQ